MTNQRAGPTAGTALPDKSAGFTDEELITFLILSLVEKLEKHDLIKDS